jgi:asparagine synthase (glutamine-hydrolysing)
MSGIFGVFNFNGNPVEIEKVLTSVDAMEHQNDDIEGYLFINTRNGKCVPHVINEKGCNEKYPTNTFDLILGFYQPLISNLGKKGRQPVADNNGNTWCIYEGELYNKSDLNEQLDVSYTDEASIIISSFAKWGVDCLLRFNGLFGIVLWDLGKRELIIARDPVGGIPVFHAYSDKSFIFSTHLKSILAGKWINPRVDHGWLHDHMVNLYPATSQTCFGSIKRLMPGTYLLCKDNKLSEKRYWESLYEWENHIHQEYYVETLTNLVSDAVKVRVGNTNKVSVHLSGGLDSSTIVGALAKDFGGKHINTYSGKFLGYEGNSLFDETPYADLVAEKFHTNQKHVSINFSDLPNILPRLVYLLEEPDGIGAYSQYCVYRAAAIDKERTVFCGEGGDELFAGYSARVIVSALLDQYTNEETSSKILYNIFNLKFNEIRSLLMRVQPLKPLNELRIKRLKNLPFKKDFLKSLNTEFDDFLRNSLPKGYLNRALIKSFNFITPSLHQLEHRLGQAFGIYARAPLTDLNIVRFAQKLPPHMIVRNSITKYCLRMASQKFLLPSSISWRMDKMGFNAPFSLELKKPKLRTYCEDILLCNQLPEVFDKGYVGQLLNKHFTDKADKSEEIWKLMYLFEWFRAFNMSL